MLPGVGVAYLDRLHQVYREAARELEVRHRLAVH
jgi:hypothetical protein